MKIGVFTHDLQNIRYDKQGKLLHVPVLPLDNGAKTYPLVILL